MKKRVVGFCFIVVAVLTFSSCSPRYLLRAAWEEAGILWRRESIVDLIKDPATDETLRSKLQLVLDARDYAAALGLDAGKSYRRYSQIDRDVLVWVLSASKKTALEPVTWWFPFVGSVPYKGFFEKADAEAEMQSLIKRDFDTYLRPSFAFSTLGWFEDPVLSTVTRLEELPLANTVIHEIVHSTVWIGSSAEFNESLANFVGSRGAIRFFESRNDVERARIATDIWDDELRYSFFIANLVKQLEATYTAAKAENLPLSAVLERRQKVFDEAAAEWNRTRTVYKTTQFQRAEFRFNNASLIAQRIYLDRLWRFEELYQRLGGSLEKFIEVVKTIEEEVRRSKEDPFAALERHIANPSASEVNQAGTRK